MPSIDISEAQREYLDDLRADLEAEHVGEYGAVRPRDALQFLIDRYEEGDAVEAGGTGEDEDTEDAGDTDGRTEGEGGGDDGTAEEGDGEDRLRAMMQLLEEYDEEWEAVDSEDGKYAVTLPDGETEHVRTKDDVRALLFQHYA